MACYCNKCHQPVDCGDTICPRCEWEEDDERLPSLIYCPLQNLTSMVE